MNHREFSSFTEEQKLGKKTDVEFTTMMYESFRFMKSAHKGKPYHAVAMAYGRFMNIKFPDHYYICPCTGPTESESLPWVTHETAGQFTYCRTEDVKPCLVEGVRKRAGAKLPAVSQMISSLNYVMKHQNELSTFILGSHTPPMRLLKYNSGQSGAAVLKGTKRKMESAIARSGAKNQRGKITKQSDVQKGSVK